MHKCLRESFMRDRKSKISNKSACYIYTFTPKRYPTKAEIPKAIVPQIETLNTAFKIPAPPTLAEIAPNIINDKMVLPYRKKVME